MKSIIQSLRYWLIQIAPFALAILLGILLGALA